MIEYVLINVSLVLILHSYHFVTGISLPSNFVLVYVYVCYRSHFIDVSVPMFFSLCPASNSCFCPSQSVPVSVSLCASLYLFNCLCTTVPISPVDVFI